MPEPELFFEDYRVSLQGDHPGRRFMGAALDVTARAVKATAGIFTTYDERKRVGSPIVLLLPDNYTVEEANELFAHFYSSGLAEHSPIVALPPEFSEATIVGTTELSGGAGATPNGYWQFVTQLGVVDQLALLLRDEYRIVGSIMLSRMQGQDPFPAQHRKLLLRLHPLMESGFALAQSQITIGDRVAGIYAGRLTPREHQIARLVSEGASNQEVAEKLYLTPATVKSHLNRVFQKLGIRSRSQLVNAFLKADPEPGSAEAEPAP